MDIFDDQTILGLHIGELEPLMRILCQEHNESLHTYVKVMKMND